MVRTRGNAEEGWTVAEELDLSCKARPLGSRSQDRLGRYAGKKLSFRSRGVFSYESDIPALNLLSLLSEFMPGT